MTINLGKKVDIILVQEIKQEFEELTLVSIIDIPASRKLYIQLAEIRNQILVCEDADYDAFVNKGYWTYGQIEEFVTDLYAPKN